MLKARRTYPNGISRWRHMIYSFTISLWRQLTLARYNILKEILIGLFQKFDLILILESVCINNGPALAVLTWRLSFSVLRRWMWSAAFISWAALLILIGEFSERPGTIIWSLAKLESEGALLAWSASTCWCFLLRLFLLFDVLACSTKGSSWGGAWTITDCLIELGESKSTNFVLASDLFSRIYWPPAIWKFEQFYESMPYDAPEPHL